MHRKSIENVHYPIYFHAFRAFGVYQRYSSILVVRTFHSLYRSCIFALQFARRDATTYLSHTPHFLIPNSGSKTGGNKYIYQPSKQKYPRFFYLSLAHTHRLLYSLSILFVFIHHFSRILCPTLLS